MDNITPILITLALDLCTIFNDGQYYTDTDYACVGFMYNTYLQALCGGVPYA